MELAILGSGAAFADTGHQAGYLVDSRLLLDCGAPATVLLPRMGFSLSELETILISHLHGDHIGQLPTLLAARAVRFPDSPPLRVIGPRGLGDHLHLLGCLNLGERFWKEVEGRSPVEVLSVEDRYREQIGDHLVEAFEVEHSEQLHCLAYRIESGGVSLGYSGDTTYCPGIRRLAGSVDHLLCECTGWSGPAPIHLWKEEVEQLMVEAPRANFILTHLGERRPVRGAILASDGLRFNLRPPARG